MSYTPLFSEILQKAGKLKTKKQKIDYLREQSTPALRMVIKSSFDPKINWQLPEGEVPYSPNEAPEGTEHTVLAQESKKLYNFIQGGNNVLPQNKRESMFVQMLEGLHENEAEVIIAAKDKILHKIYKGLSASVVKEAFNWDDNYMINDPQKSNEYQDYAKRANV
jgi:hypothetical protein|tara:strand:+ start:199 stop:693 length:495 start_codon:yes stop_codon:yes gene_type:complete